jgi:Ca2+-binding EF-hand superfamily protein
VIDVQDLQSAFRAQGKICSENEIRDWVGKRDSTGKGAVNFEDFVAYYK